MENAGKRDSITGVEGLGIGSSPGLCKRFWGVTGVTLNSWNAFTLSHFFALSTNPKIRAYKLRTISIWQYFTREACWTLPRSSLLEVTFKLSKDATLAMHEHALIPTTGVDRSSSFWAISILMWAHVIFSMSPWLELKHTAPGTAKWFNKWSRLSCQVTAQRKKIHDCLTYIVQGIRDAYKQSRLEPTALWKNPRLIHILIG